LLSRLFVATRRQPIPKPTHFPDPGISSGLKRLKTYELEQRLSRLEVCCTGIQDRFTRFERSVAALQAELDHMRAKTGR
jgi:hypothetical protein